MNPPPPGLRTTRPADEAEERVDPPPAVAAAATDSGKALPAESRLLSRTEATEGDVGDAPDAHEASCWVVGDANDERLAALAALPPPLPRVPVLVPPVEGVLVALLVRSLLGERTWKSLVTLLPYDVPPVLIGVAEAAAEAATDEEGDLILPPSHGLAMALRARTLGDVRDATSARVELT